MLLTKLRRMDKHSENINRDEKYRKVQNRSHESEEYINWTEKYTRDLALN